LRKILNNLRKTVEMLCTFTTPRRSDVKFSSPAHKSVTVSIYSRAAAAAWTRYVNSRPS